MSIQNPFGGSNRKESYKPILKAEIEEAQRNTNSNQAAARFLNVDYRVYKRYAELYGLFESHKNERGVGIDKGYSKNPKSVPLKEIFNNQHPNYSPAKLKNRLLARKLLPNECSLCHFNEKRITDQKVPLILTFIDGNNKNFSKDNLQLLCYNCMFLTTGAPRVAHHRHIEKSYNEQEAIPKTSTIEPTMADYHDTNDKYVMNDESLVLTEEEKRKIIEELEDT
jgi:hypothetical protein